MEDVLGEFCSKDLNSILTDLVEEVRSYVAGRTETIRSFLLSFGKTYLAERIFVKLQYYHCSRLKIADFLPRL
jgi:hypothetical protein